MEDCLSIVNEIVSIAMKKSDYFKERQTIRTRNEVLPDLSKLNIVYKDEYTSTALLELGTVLHSTEGYIVISASPKSPLLELDTKVCKENGLIIGTIDDIIGSVSTPHYSVIAYHPINAGQTVYYPNNASILTNLSRKRGTDASNNNDEETSEESSDDLEEKPQKQTKKVFKIFSQPPPFE